MIPRRSIHRLSAALIDSDFTPEDLAFRIHHICPDASKRWAAPVIDQLANSYRDQTRPRLSTLEAELKHHPAVEKAFSGKRPPSLNFDDFLSLPNAKMKPATGSIAAWDLPSIVDQHALAEHLSIHPDDLHWLTVQSYRKTDHYHYRWHAKRNNKTHRLIEIPKPLLKLTQRTMLDQIIERIPVHPAACGFRPEKSVIDFVKPHCGQRLVLKLDLVDFFPSITANRIVRLFMTAGYPESVAITLASLATNAVKDSLLKSAPHASFSITKQARYQRPHLPQGAPTSPSLANLCAYKLDCRLSGLARAFHATYTRYADDLLFSGPDAFRRQARSFYHRVLAIIVEEGFEANLRKTRFMPSSQRQYAAGLVINESPNLQRREYDSLKAILHNSASHGPKAQNHDQHDDFKSHVRGRIEWVRCTNTKRAEKLDTLFERVEWS